MSLVKIDLKNESPSAALHYSFQDRVSERADGATASGVPVVRDFNCTLSEDTREQYSDYGSEMVTVTIRGTDRQTQMPRWQAEDASSLAHWIAQRIARRDSTAAAPPILRGVRMLDKWGDLRRGNGIAAHDSALIQLTDAQRVVIECGEDTYIALRNPSGVHSLRLRQMDKKTGKTSNVTILQRGSQETGTITITPKLAAVIEVMPS